MYKSLTSQIRCEFGFLIAPTVLKIIKDKTKKKQLIEKIFKNIYKLVSRAKHASALGFYCFLLFSR